MKLIDTHNHLYVEEFDEDRDLLVKKAYDTGIDKILLPNIDLSTVGRMFDLCDKYPCFAYPMMGVHPTSVGRNYVSELVSIEQCLSKRMYCGIGEIGLDLYWDKSFLKEQIIVFEEQLKWSMDLNLPVAIHVREAMSYTLESIYKVGANRLFGVFHSFTGDTNDLSEVEKLQNFKIGVNGVLTFKNAKLAEVVRKTSLSKLLLETDAPYLSPVPYRGKRNEPQYIWKTAEKLADVFETTLDNVVQTTRRNALGLFKITDSSV